MANLEGWYGMLNRDSIRIHPDRLLFLDIDGVLNGHEKMENGYSGINPVKMKWLNRITEIVEPMIVLSSSWRYMILHGEMTLTGFKYLLTINGASEQTVKGLIGYLDKDRDINNINDRGELCYIWINERISNPKLKVVALDDGSWPDGNDLGYGSVGIPWVRPNPKVGLTGELVQQVIYILKGK